MRKGPRQIAHDVLSRVGARSGFANNELSIVFKRNRNLDPRDRSLVTEIVYGVLRNRLLLDYRLATFSKMPLADVEKPTLDAMRMALYQVLFLDRVPDSAAVNDSVNLSPKRSKGFVNGVLRSLVRGKHQLNLNGLPEGSAERLSVEFSHPRWLVDRWIERRGYDETKQRLIRNNRRPGLTFRTNLLRTTREELIEELQRGGLKAEASVYLPEAILVKQVSDLEGQKGLKTGLFMVQDEAAQGVSYLLDPKPGERILDACAAPGGKSTHLAQLMGDEGVVVALDLDAARLKLVSENACRLQTGTVKTLRGDAERPPEKIGLFDRVLVDAPCSSLGLLHKQPDIRWRRGTTDFRNLAERQARILQGVAPLVKPGGVLVYSVCTTEPEETVEVVKGFLAAHPAFRRRPAGEVLKGELAGLVSTDGYYRTDDPQLDLDGFFAVRMEHETD